MRIRNGFVSNSSSSSFLIVGKLPDESKNFGNIFYEIRDLDLRERILKRKLNEFKECKKNSCVSDDGYYDKNIKLVKNALKNKKPVYVTTDIYDGNDNYTKLAYLDNSVYYNSGSYNTIEYSKNDVTVNFLLTDIIPELQLGLLDEDQLRKLIKLYNSFVPNSYKIRLG